MVRKYPTYPNRPGAELPAGHSYRNRAVALYKKEMQKIDVMMFRITDVAHQRDARRGKPRRTGPADHGGKFSSGSIGYVGYCEEEGSP